MKNKNTKDKKGKIKDKASTAEISGSGGANKGWLIKHMSEEYNCTKVDAQRYLDMVTETLMVGLKANSKISLIGFGSFTVQRRAERKGRNPRSGEEIIIGPYNQISFKAGTEFKNRVASTETKSKTKSKA